MQVINLINLSRRSVSIITICLNIVDFLLKLHIHSLINILLYQSFDKCRIRNIHLLIKFQDLKYRFFDSEFFKQVITGDDAL